MRHTLRGALSTALAVAACALISVPRLTAQSTEEVIDGHRARKGEVIIRYRTAPTLEKLAAMDQLVNAETRKKLSQQEHWHYKSKSLDIPTLVSVALSDPDVAFVEPNYIITSTAAPNDPSFSLQWGLRNTGQGVNGNSGGSPGADIGAVTAWDVTTGSTGIVVAVLDSGVDLTHPDLTANLWSAPAKFVVTVGGVSITCLAASKGFNALNNACTPADDYGHGTHIAGIIGATGNNGAGVSGVSRTTRIMSIKVLDATGVGSVADAIEGIEFAIQTKLKFASTAGANVRVLNASWGGGAFSQALQDQIAKANTNDMLFVTSAGNDGVNTDVVPYYPAGYNVANIVSVGATDNADLPPTFTNYGAKTVELSAPGVNIYSTTKSLTYGFKSGTSQAAAFVSGAASLILSRCTLNTAGLRDNLMAYATVLPGLTGLSATGARLNVDASVRGCPAPPPAPTGLKAASGSTQVTLSWNETPGAASYVVSRSTRATSSYVVVASGLTTPTYTSTGLANGTTYYFKVAAVNGVGRSADSAYVIGTPAAIPTQVIGLKATGQTGQVYLAWSAATGATGYYVKMSTVAGGPYTRIGQTTSRTYYAKGLIKGTKYCFVVAGYNKNYVEGPGSLEVCAIVQ